MQPLHIGFNSSHCGRFLLDMPTSTCCLGNHTLTRRRLHESHPVRTFLWDTFLKAILDLSKRQMRCHMSAKMERGENTNAREARTRRSNMYGTNKRQARSGERRAMNDEREPMSENRKCEQSTKEA